MKPKFMIILLSIFIAMGLHVTGQDSLNRSRNFITVNSKEAEEQEALRKMTFRYDDFIQSRLINKDGAELESSMNYHRFYQKLYFIKNGDTLILAHPATYKLFILGKDSFYFTGNGFAWQLTQLSKINLAKSEFISLVGREKQGLYGTYSAVSSANSELTFTNDDQHRTIWIKPDQNLIYKLETRYYLKDEFNNFFPATKKNFYELFASQESLLRSYLRKNKVKYDKEEDLLELINYMQSSE